MAFRDSAVFELGGYEFGHVTGPMRTFAWDPGAVTFRTNDVDSPTGPGRLMGRDSQEAGSWRIDLRTLVPGGEIAAQAEVSRLARVWRPPSGPVETMALRYRLADRWRRVYGRPRGMILPTTDVLVNTGRADVSCIFDLADPNHYDDALNSVPYSGVGQTAGGLVAPLRAPLSTRRTSGASARFITVGGDAPTPLAVRFSGPSITPRLWTADGRIDIRLTGTLAYDQSVTVDARQQTVIRNDGASVPGMLSPRTRLADLVLPPGVHEVFFSGAAEATALLAWRNAWRSL